MIDRLRVSNHEPQTLLMSSSANCTPGEWCTSAAAASMSYQAVRRPIVEKRLFLPTTLTSDALTHAGAALVLSTER